MVTTLQIFMYKKCVTNLVRRVFPDTNHYSDGDETFIYTSHEGEGYNVAFPKDLSYLIQREVEPSNIAYYMINQLVSLIMEGESE